MAASRPAPAPASTRVASSTAFCSTWPGTTGSRRPPRHRPARPAGARPPARRHPGRGRAAARRPCRRSACSRGPAPAPGRAARARTTPATGRVACPVPDLHAARAAIVTAPPRRPTTLLRHRHPPEEIVTRTAVAAPRVRGGGHSVLVALTAANGLGYLLTVVASRRLGPEGYGALAALLGLVLVGNVLALGLQAVVARRVVAGGVADAARWAPRVTAAERCRARRGRPAGLPGGRRPAPPGIGLAGGAAGGDPRPADRARRAARAAAGRGADARAGRPLRRRRCRQGRGRRRRGLWGAASRRPWPGPRWARRRPPSWGPCRSAGRCRPPGRLRAAGRGAGRDGTRDVLPRCAVHADQR